MPNATVVQFGFKDDAQVAGSTLTFNITGVTVGNRIHAVGFCDPTAANIVGIAGTVGDVGSYIQMGSNVVDVGNDGEMGQFYRDVTATSGGAITIVLTVSASSTFKGIYFAEINNVFGVPQTASIISDPQAPGGTTDAITTGNRTPSAQPALISSVCLDVTNNRAPTFGTGYTLLGAGWQFGLGGNGATAESRRITALTALPVTYTAAGGFGGDAYMLAAAFFTEGTAPPPGNGIFFGAGTTS
jgi:hypothetical protein